MTVALKIKELFKPLKLTPTTEFCRTDILVIDYDGKTTMSLSCKPNDIYWTFTDEINKLFGVDFDWDYEPLRSLGKDKQLSKLFDLKRSQSQNPDFPDFLEVESHDLYFYNDKDFKGDYTKLQQQVKDLGWIYFRTTFFKDIAKANDIEFKAKGKEIEEKAIELICESYQIKRSLFNFLCKKSKFWNDNPLRDRGFLTSEEEVEQSLNRILDFEEIVSHYRAVVKIEKPKNPIPPELSEAVMSSLQDVMAKQLGTKNKGAL